MDNPLVDESYVIDPPDYVTFEINSLGPKEAVLTLTNTSENTLAYKVKISSKDKQRYVVQPASAIVRRKTKIRFLMREEYVKELLERHQTSDDAAENKDRFLIQILHLSPSFFNALSSQSEITSSVEREWRQQNSKKLSNCKLRVRFVLPPKSANTLVPQDANADGQPIETLKEQFNQLKKLEGQYHDVCKQYTASVMENKKLRRQLDDKNKVIDELRSSVAEKSGLRQRFGDSMQKSGVMSKAQSLRRFGLFQIIIVAVSCFMLGRLLSRR